MRPAGPGFTLIELLAVILIFGLLAAIAIPTFGLRGRRALHAEGERLAAALELARQRAVMTGRAHQVVLDIEGGLHRVEWNAAPLETPSEPPPASEDPLAFDLSPPSPEQTEFVPIPDALGRDSPFEEGIDVLRVELPEGPALEAEVTIEFAPDGTADPATIRLEETDGGRRLSLEVRRLAPAVVIRDESL